MSYRSSMALRPVLRRLGDWVVPGIPRVRAQAEPFARAWRDANSVALSEAGPIWVALGDSMSQGIGAADIRGGWVGQLHDRLSAQGHPLRLVNLSVTGAGVHSVLTAQLPQVGSLEPLALVTVLVGANDMLSRRRRRAAVGQFAALLSRLPAEQTVVATLPRRNHEARAINALIERAAAEGHIRVADMRTLTLRSILGGLAEDFFHPNERGYAFIADVFARAIDDSLSPGRPL